MTYVNSQKVAIKQEVFVTRFRHGWLISSSIILYFFNYFKLVYLLRRMLRSFVKWIWRLKKCADDFFFKNSLVSHGLFSFYIYGLIGYFKFWIILNQILNHEPCLWYFKSWWFRIRLSYRNAFNSSNSLICKKY